MGTASARPTSCKWNNSTGCSARLKPDILFALFDIAISGWASIPFCDSGGPRQYVFGTFINTASSSTNSSKAFNDTKAELLREQIHAGLASCNHLPFIKTYIAQVNK
jgi:hypothetical protein